MTEDIKVLDTLVTKLNNEAYDQTLYSKGGIALLPYELNVGGCDGEQSIEFYGFTLWASDEDDRESFDREHVEDIESFVRREAAAFIERLSGIKPLAFKSKQ